MKMCARKLSEFLVYLCATGLAQDISVGSPDARAQFRLSRAETNLEYSVTFRDKPVIETSALGITIDKNNLSQGVQIGKVDRYEPLICANLSQPYSVMNSDTIKRFHSRVFIQLVITEDQRRLAVNRRAAQDVRSRQHDRRDADWAV